MRPSFALLSFFTVITTISASSARAEKILMIGDSLTCGPFGVRTVENLKAAGHEVTMYCMVGSSPEQWLSGTNILGQICQTMTSRMRRPEPCEPKGAMMKLTEILAKTPADRVIVGLGTNSLPGGTTASAAYQQMANLVRAKGRCQWIGPPHLNSAQAIGWSRHKRGSPEDVEASRLRIAQLEGNLGPFYNSLTAKVDAACPLIDSRTATATGPAHETNDGIHRGPIGGRSWADALRNQIGSSPRRAGGGSPRAGSR